MQNFGGSLRGFLRGSGRMQRLLGFAAFDIDNDHHPYYAFQRRLLCAEPDAGQIVAYDISSGTLNKIGA